MVWSHYKEETKTGDIHHNDAPDHYDDRIFPPYEPLDFETWKDWHSNDIMNMWLSLRTYLTDSVLQNDVMCDADYDDFCEYLYRFSTKFPSKNAT